MTMLNFSLLGHLLCCYVDAATGPQETLGRQGHPKVTGPSTCSHDPSLENGLRAIDTLWLCWTTGHLWEVHMGEVPGGERLAVGP